MTGYIDPGSIMAGHQPMMSYARREHCMKCGPVSGYPCLPYCLAEQLEKAYERGDRRATEKAALRDEVERLTERAEKAEAKIADAERLAQRAEESVLIAKMEGKKLRPVVTIAELRAALDGAE